MSKLLDFVNADIKGEILSSLPSFIAGDTVNVHVKIKEGAKERIQQYQGVSLAHIAQRCGRCATAATIHRFAAGGEALHRRQTLHQLSHAGCA